MGLLGCCMTGNWEKSKLEVPEGRILRLLRAVGQATLDLSVTSEQRNSEMQALCQI